MKKLTLALMLLAAPCFATVVCAQDSPKDVQAAIARGDLPGAEKMLREVVANHPNSAKAHYVLAEVLAHEGNIGEAKTEAAKAATIDPATKFTDPAKFQQFQRELNTALAPASAGRVGNARAAEGQSLQPPAQRAQGGFPVIPVLVVIGIIVLIAIWSARRRRQQANPFGNGNAPYGAPPPAPYGDNYGQNGAYGNNPGYPPPYPPQRGSGAGAAVAAGLGGLAAGALLDEAFRSHREGEVPPDTNAVGGGTNADPSGQAYDELRNDPIDMGNNDSSWDDSSSGDSGSFDDNQW